MRKRLFLMVLSAGVVAIAACVGDDPTGGVTSPVAEAGAPGSIDGAASDASIGDAPVDSASPVDAFAPKPFDVRTLGGVRLWLESTRELTPEAAGSTGFGSWSDGSGRWDGGGAGAPDGGRLIALPHNVNPPSIVSNAFAGRPTVSFVAGNGYLHIENHEDFHFGLGDFLIVEVAKVVSGSGPLWLLRPNATAGSEESFFPGQLCVVYGMGVTNGCTTPVFTPSTEPHVFVARRRSDLFTLRVDGTVRGTLDRSVDPPNIIVGPFAQQYAFIGNNETMQVSEIVVIVGPTPDTDLATLEAHLKTKYAIP